MILREERERPALPSAALCFSVCWTFVEVPDLFRKMERSEECHPPLSRLLSFIFVVLTILEVAILHRLNGETGTFFPVNSRLSSLFHSTVLNTKYCHGYGTDECMLLVLRVAAMK